MTTPSKYRPRCCNECGDGYTPRRADEFYCSIPCRKAFENRRMVRGRDLYDLFMCLRYERGVARALGIWAIACRLAQGWREEDTRDRDGRKSWMPAKRVIDKMPVTMKEVDVYVRREKFDRSDATGKGTGGIIGVADVVDCVEICESDWFVGKYGFILANQRPVPFIPVKGALGFFDWRKNL